MKYYIQNGNSWTQVQVEIEPKLSKAFDTTNDSISVVLRANNLEEPYKPMTKFRIVESGTDPIEEIYWIINDSVDIFSAKPLKYKHTLSIVQYRYFLNKQIIRNTVFNQPRKNKLKLYGAASTNLSIQNYHDEEDIVQYEHLVSNNSTKYPNWWGDKIKIGSHTKIKSLSYYIDIYAGVNGAALDIAAGHWIKLSALSSTNNIQFNNNVKFCLVDLGTQEIIYSFYIYQDAFQGKITLDDAAIESLNQYFEDNPNANIKVFLWADGVEGLTSFTAGAFSFVKVISNRIPSDDPSLINKERFLYLTAQINIDLEIYNYNMWDVLNVLQQQNRLTYMKNGLEYSKRTIDFGLPRGSVLAPYYERELYKLLTETYPPDTLAFTQATFYDALTEIFRFYDAGFNFDKNNRLRIEYYNNPENEITPTLIGKQMSHSDKNFNNGRIAYYQNAILEVNLPRTKVRSQTLGVPGDNDYGIVLEKPIYEVNSLCVDVSATNFFPPLAYSTYGYIFDRMNLDLTPFLVNDQEYSVLDKADPDNYTQTDDLTIKYQSSVLHFARGGNFISVSETYQNGSNNKIYKMDNVLGLAAARYFGYGYVLGSPIAYKPTKFKIPGSANWSAYVFSINYQTMNNGRSQTETATFKYNGQQLVNQNAGIIDLNKLGLNMLGESLKDGEPTLTGNCIITKWEDRIKEGDYFVDSEGNYWVANVVNYVEIVPDKYRCSVEFSKNFNALALRVNSDKEKRLTNVSSEQTTVSEDCFIDYIYAYPPSASLDVSEEIVLGDDILSSMICQTFKDNRYTNYNVRFGMITSYDSNEDMNTYGDGQYAQNQYIPILKYGLGNCICFEMQYSNPLSAGNKLTKTSGWFGTDKYFSSAALYTNDEGWADYIDISFCDLTPAGEKNNIGDFPTIDSNNIGYNDTTKYVNVISQIQKLYYYKKPNEIFALNYEWCFLVPKSYQQNFFIGNKFINENFFTNKEAIATKKFFLRYIESSEANDYEKYTILDKKGIGIKTVKVTSIHSEIADHVVQIGFTIASPSFGNHYAYAARWAIVDENNDIYFASNLNATFMDSESYPLFQIRFVTSRTRKDF